MTQIEEALQQQERTIWRDFVTIQIMHPDWGGGRTSMSLRLDAIETIESTLTSMLITAEEVFVITMKSGRQILAVDLGSLRTLIDGWA